MKYVQQIWLRRGNCMLSSVQGTEGMKQSCRESSHSVSACVLCKNTSMLAAQIKA